MRGADTDTEPSIGALFGQLGADAKEAARAEIALRRAQGDAYVVWLKTPIGLFAAAGLVAYACLVALLVGLILSLATLIGPGGATAIVVLGGLAIAAILALIGRSMLRNNKP